VRRVGDEASLLVEGSLEPAEHLVHRGGEVADFVARPRHGNAMSEIAP